MDPRLLYIRQRLRRRGGEGGGAPITWTVDATSNKPVPANATEWADFITAKSLTIAVPNYLHLCQEASGDLADSIGSLTLTANGTPLYQQTVTGWTRKGVKGNATTANQRFLNSSAPNPSTTSIARLAYISVGTLDTLGREILGNGSSGDVSVQALTVGGINTIRYREGSNISDTTNAGYGATAFPIMLVVNQTTSAARLFTPLAKVSPTFGAPSTSTNYFIGAQSGTWADVTVIYECGWQGADAEISDAEAKALFEAFGYTIEWS